MPTLQQEAEEALENKVPLKKEELLEQLENKYQPLLQVAIEKHMQAEMEKMSIQMEYDEKRRRIGEYFYAVDNVQNMIDALNNLPTI